jgi:tetratricopeptide (TPR) repeat protein
MLMRLGLSLCIGCLSPSLAAQSSSTPQVQEILKNASSLLSKSEYLQAIPLLRQAKDLAPRDAEANRLLGVALLQSGAPAEAIAPLRIAASATPVDEAAEGYLGDAEMQTGNFTDASETFQGAVRRSPTSEQALVWWTGFCLERYRRLSFSIRETPRGRAELLRIAAANGQVDLKTRKLWLTQAATLDPNSSDVWGQLGIIEVSLSEFAGAETSLNHALQSSQRALPTLKLQALIAASHGDWNSAEKKLEDIENRSQFESTEFLARWPHTLMPAANLRDAIWQCLRENSTDCSSKLTRTLLVASQPIEQLYREGRWEQLAASPDPAPQANEQWFCRGVALATLGKCTLAIPALERGLPAGAEAGAARLADCYQRQAILTADKLQAQGKDATVHQIRGDILLSIRQDATQALKEYAAALSLKPNDPQLLEKTAEAQFTLGDMDGAKTNAQAAFALNPNRLQLLRLLIRVAMSERDYSAALAFIDRLTRITPADNWAQVQQGTAFAAMGRTEEAAQRLKAPLDAGYPDEKGALHALLAAQLRKLGRNDEAKVASQEAIKLADSFQEQSQHLNAAPQER